jgi:hypothetical protein
MAMSAAAREYFNAEFQRLDLLLHREVLRLRASYQLSLDEFRGLYVSDQQIDSLIARRSDAGAGNPSAEDLTRQAGQLRREIDARLDGRLPWDRLVREFGLNAEETEILLIGLAPEFDLKYETLYAYLNNDITRKWPTVDLARRLTDQTAPIASDSALFTSGLLQPFPAAPERSSWLAHGLRSASIVAPFLLERPVLDSVLAEFCVLEKEPSGWDETQARSNAPEDLRRAESPLPLENFPAMVFIGRAGSGRRKAAGAICAAAGMSLLVADLAAGGTWPQCGAAVALQARLLGAGIFLHNGETLFDREGNPLAESRRFLKAVLASRRPVILGIAPGWDWHELMQGLPALPFSFEMPEYESRILLWRENLDQRGVPATAEELDTLAGRFILSPGQIEEAASLAAARQLLHDGRPQTASVTLLKAARDTSSQSLGRLAVKLDLTHDWSDLVLPAATLCRAREVTAAIRNNSVVFEQWDFQRRVTSGRGLKVLFSGSSGTGKTMTAGIIARELGLDIYRIDLSGIVSKYIGETEKNLERIFRAAESSNAILFFDEADALFGKRSEVKDAHDRYANIEISYLLQKIEEYAGVVILASNLSQNIDNAFARRMHCVIEFPMPDETHREKLWRGMFPARAPLGDDVDFPFLARQFSLSGGEIRNVSLEAAYLAAQDGRVIRMEHLVRAMARQMLKQGRLPSPADFKQHYALIGRE